MLRVIKQPFAGAQEDRCDNEVDFVNEAGDEELLDGRWAASQHHVLAFGRFGCLG